MNRTQVYGQSPWPEDQDRTQQITPGDPNRTQAVPSGASGIDMNRTQMAAPGVTGIELEVIKGNELALSTRNTREHVLARVKAGQASLGQRMPLNVCLLMDRSASMEGQPLEYAKRAMAHVVDLLQPADVLSVVTFEDQVDVLMPARRVVNKELIKQHINAVQVGNTTNIYDGIRTACQQVASVPQGYVNRVIMLTDGDPTAGITDFPSIVGQVAEQKSRGITITALGFGPEYNEELLAGMARRSGGNYYYIARPELLPEVFRKEMESLLSVVGRNLRLLIRPTRWTQVRQVYGKQLNWHDRSIEVTLADLERGSSINSLIEMELSNRPPGIYRAAVVELLYDDAVSGRQERKSVDVVFNFTTDEAAVDAGRNPVVYQELEVAMQSRNLEKTVMGMRTQGLSPEIAVRELEKTQAILLSQGKAEEAAQVKQAIDAARSGADLQKTLIGTVLNLDQGKHKDSE